VRGVRPDGLPRRGISCGGRRGSISAHWSAVRKPGVEGGSSCRAGKIRAPFLFEARNESTDVRGREVLESELEWLVIPESG